MCYRGHLFVCVSVLHKIMNNFWMDGPIWTKFSWVAWLVLTNYWVGSTSALSTPVRTWPAHSPFPFFLVAATGSRHTISESIWWGKPKCDSRFLNLGLGPHLHVERAGPLFGGEEGFERHFRGWGLIDPFLGLDVSMPPFWGGGGSGRR